MDIEKIIIPDSLHIVVDDLGWFNGKDDRENDGPSRTGMPRRHCAEDYRAVNELGRRLNMKISCAFVMGEWDFDNRLRNIPCLSRYGENWDNASYFDEREAVECVRAINESEYIDFNVHGLLHGNYRNPSDDHDISDFYYRVDGVLYMVEESEVRARLDAFFDLVNCHGIKKRINSFVPPSFNYRADELSLILADYGIRFVSTIFSERMLGKSREEDTVILENGIVTLDRNNNLVPWDAYDYDPKNIPVSSGIFGIHWPNLLHLDPKRNIEVVDRWEKYFDKCADTFGIILARDISFAAAQSLVKRYARVESTDNSIKIDLSDVPLLAGLDNSFAVSSRYEITTACGAEIEPLDIKDGFINYKVIPTDKIVKLA